MALPNDRQAGDIPPDVERYVKEGEAAGMPTDKAWAVAWSRWCGYKSPGDKHCTKSKGKYFPGRKAKPEKVAYRFLVAGTRMVAKVRSDINRDLRNRGMDGNKRFPNAGSVLNTIGTVLVGNGVEWGEVINSHAISQPNGRMNISLAFSNPEDAFSPVDITNTNLSLHWTTLETGLEVVAYLG